MKTTVKMNFEELENVSGGAPNFQNTIQNEIVFEAQSNKLFIRR